MKNLFIISSMLLLPFLGISQDIIIKLNQDEIQSKVIEITDTHIKYRDFDFQEGPILNIKKSEVFMIIYENGRRQPITEKSTRFNSNSTEKPENTVVKFYPHTAKESNINIRVDYGIPQEYEDYIDGFYTKWGHESISINSHIRFKKGTAEGVGLSPMINYSFGMLDEYYDYSVTNIGLGGSYCKYLDNRGRIRITAESGVHTSWLTIENETYSAENLGIIQPFYYYAATLDLLVSDGLGFNLRYDSFGDVGLLFGVNIHFGY